MVTADHPDQRLFRWHDWQVFHTVLTRNLGGPFENDNVLAKIAQEALRRALKVGAFCSTYSQTFLQVTLQ